MEILKEWGSPRSNVQIFMPQEYCEGCTEVHDQQANWNYSTSKRLYIDKNGDTVYSGSNESVTPKKTFRWAEYLDFKNLGTTIKGYLRSSSVPSGTNLSYSDSSFTEVDIIKFGSSYAILGRTSSNIDDYLDFHVNAGS